MYINRSILTAFLLSLIGLMHAQHPYFYSLGADQGLPVKQIFEVYQDKKSNHIWLGTNAGLYEYNGTDFELHLAKGQTGTSVSSIQEDVEGGIWYRNFRGQILNVNHDSAQVFIDWKDSCVAFPAIYVSGDNQLLVSHKSGISSYNIQQKKWNNTIPIQTSQVDLNPIFKFNDKTGKTYFTSNELACYYSNSVIVAQALPKKPILVNLFYFNDKVYKFFLDKSFSFWNEQEQQETKRYLDLPVANGERVFCFTELNNGMLAVGTAGGMVLFDAQFNRINSNPYFKDSKVSWIQEDLEGNIWVATLDDGLMVIPNLEFKVYNKQNSPFEEIFSLQAGKNRLYLGALTGEVYSMGKNKEIEQLNAGVPKHEIYGFYKNTMNDRVYYFHSNQVCYIDRNQRIVKTTTRLNSGKQIRFYDRFILIPYAYGIFLLRESDQSAHEAPPIPQEFGVRFLDHFQSLLLQ